MRPRVTLLGLMVAVTFVAVAFAALRSSSDLWASAFYTMSTVLLLTAVIAAKFRRGQEGAFWFGFAVFGWGFLFLGLGPGTNPLAFLREESGGGLNKELLTSKLVLFLVSHMREETNNLDLIDEITANTTAIAHMLTTLALATCGGIVAAVIRKRRRRPDRHDVAKAAGILTGLILIPTILSGYLARQPKPYFPAAVVNEREGISEFRVEWYTKHLRAMEEPSLWWLSRQDPGATVYRFLWLPSFDHPVCVRIDKSGRGARLQAIVLDGLGGYGPGQVAIEKTVILDDDQWSKFLAHLEKADYWDMPTRLVDDGGSDGDQLIVEGVRGGNYHVVDRWEPDSTYAGLCRYMFELTGLKVGKDWRGYDIVGDTDEPPA